MALETLKIIELELEFSVLDKCPRNWERPVIYQNRYWAWSGRKDLNLRPLAPHASTLPGCATPRLVANDIWSFSK